MDSPRLADVRFWWMRTGIMTELTAGDRTRLETIAADRNTPQKHVWRTPIVLLSADGIGTNEIRRETGVSKTCVWRRQERFMTEGVDGLLRDKTRPARLAALSGEVAASIVPETLGKPPGETTHWTASAMAKAIGVSVSSVQRVWRRHGLQPHRIRQFKLSNDKRFAEKLRNAVGLYLDPPAHAVVFSFAEKSQIQALDRTQPGLPLKKGRCGTMTHAYKRHGTTRSLPLSTCSMDRSSGNACSGTGIKSSSASSTRLKPRFKLARSSM